MKMTGQILKENRERRGISVNEVAIATKINVRTIMAMEAGDVDRLPPKTFLRGFVRAYATYLELDVESLLNTFYDEMGSTKPKTIEPPTESSGGASGPRIPRITRPRSEANDAINPSTSPTKTIGAVAGILVLVVLIVIFKNKMESYEREAIVEKVPTGIESLPSPTPVPLDALNEGPDPVSSPLPGGTAPAVTPSASPAPSPSAKPTATPSPTPTPKPTASPTATPKPTATATPKPSPTATATPKPTPTATPKPSPTPTPTPKPTPTPTPKPSPTPTATPKPSPSPTATAKPSPSPTPKPSPSASPVAAAAASPSPSPTAKPDSKKNFEVLIEAFKAVTIEATIDGQTKSIPLKADQVHSIKASRKVILNLSDGGAVNLTVNGSDRGVPGDLGKPKRIELP